MPKSPQILLADADVLIDYRDSDLSILELVSKEIGRVYVLREVLLTVRGMSEKACDRHGIQPISAATDVLIEAGASGGSLSFEDWVCLITCRERSWTLVTNDAALIRACKSECIEVRRGLGLMIELVSRGKLEEKRAARIAEMIHQVNPMHINERVLRTFEQALQRKVKS